MFENLMKYFESVKERPCPGVKAAMRSSILTKTVRQQAVDSTIHERQIGSSGRAK